MRRFKSPAHAHGSCRVQGGIPHFRPRRHLLSAAEYRQVMADRFTAWRQVTEPLTRPEHTTTSAYSNEMRSNQPIVKSFSQPDNALGIALCRYILAFSPLVDMERQEVIDWIGPTLQRYLTG